jgi:hypothetical protein
MKRNGEAGSDRSVFFQSEEEAKRVWKEKGSLNREMKAKIIAKEKEIESIMAARVKEESTLTKAKAIYLDQFPKVEARKREKIAASNTAEDDYKARRISLNQYIRDAIKPEKLNKMAKEAAFKKLSGLLTAIRKRAARIIELEIEELMHKQDIFFLKVFPAQNEIAQLRGRIKALEAGISEVLSEQPATCRRLDHLKTIKEGRQTWAQWSGLDESGVKALLFDPMLPSEYIEKLEEIILKISGSGKTYQITWADKWKDFSLMEE